ncbi:MAG: hypothetical protein AMXMBFR4_22760 [Candidatus Hydrogenedentota bacterium]
MFHNLKENPPTRAELLCLAALTLAAACARFYRLDRQSLWFDEICSWHTAIHDSLIDVALADRDWNMYPPGYGILLHFITRFAGDSEWTLRAPSAFARTIAVPLLFLIGWRLYGRKEGLIAAGFAAFAIFSVYFAQEARPYSLLYVSVLAAVFAWTYVIDAWSLQRGAPSWALTLYFLASCACNYLHYFGVLFTFLSGIVSFALLIRKPARLSRALGLYGALALAYTPWLPSMWRHFRNQDAGPQNPPVDSDIFTAFYDFISSAFNHGQTGTPLAHVITVAALLLYALVLGHTIFALARLPASSANRNALVARLFLMTAWLLLPFLFAYTKSVFSASIFTHRNLSISLPAIYLLAARGITRLPLPSPATAAVGAVVVCASLLRLLTSGYYTAPHKDQFREAVQYVVGREQQHPNAELIVYSHLPFTFDYYLTRFGSTRTPALQAGREDDIEKVRAFVAERNPESIWYLCSEPYPENAFVDFLNRDFYVIDMQQFLRVHVLLLVPKQTGTKPPSSLGPADERSGST